MRKIFLFCIVFIAFVSCQSDDVSTNRSTNDYCEPYNKTSVRPISEALDELNQTLDAIYTGTRSNDRKSYSESNVRTFVLDNVTRSNVKVDLPDTLVYIVDFDNGGGYAILGAQYDISPIFSITENGVFDTDKFAEAIRYEVENNIITLEECEQRSLESIEEHDLNNLTTDDNFVYELMASYVIDDAIDGPIILDPTPVTPPITPPSLIRTTTYTTMEIVENYPPLLTTEWHQGSPFNLKCKNDDSELCPVGCTVTALAQIIA